jgi:uncharacterized protein YbjQ (UPF0145 family)
MHGKRLGIELIIQFKKGDEAIMIISTTEGIAGYEVTEVLGTTFGVVVRARGIGGDIMASLKGLVGGEVTQYTQMVEDGRKQAMDRMVKNAAAMGGDAVIMMRFDSGDIGQNMSEIVAYGTAVRLQKL